MKIIRIAIAALLVLAVAAIAGVGRPETAGGASDDPREGITVTGVGSVDAVPDRAEFSLGVTTKGATAREALTANNARMSQVIAALKAAGVEERDIRTENVSVGESYEGDGRPSGFAAQNSVSVRILDLDRASAVLDAASRAGANQLSGPALTRNDRERLEHKALQEAVKNARNRAEALAEAAGVDVGRVTAISESLSGGPEIYEGRVAMDSSASKVPIEEGTQEIQASVSVTFAIE
ncbi:MAG: SIMPL domain-containing protein [Actinobacteria bacterium]|nr:SIMPL domain-containing protein [Actinomycetota bacterium]